MLFERVMLDETNDKIYLDVYVADPLSRVCDAMLVIPGGGYRICSEREGEPIALSYMAKGYNAFVLQYPINEEALFPAPLIAASKAMKHIKDNAEKYNINPDRVFACGFSAGGHLCTSLGVLWDMKEIYEAVDMPVGYNKPKAVVPVYPVVSGVVEGTHFGSFHQILGTTTPTQEQLEKYSLEKSVSEKTVPMFIVHTADDNAVSVRNSLVLAQALTDAGVMYEMHIYASCPHGMSLCNEITACGYDEHINPHNAKWLDESVEWLKSIK